MAFDEETLKSLAPKAPGYMLAPTKFVLKGEAIDFIDWEEPNDSGETGYGAS